MTKRDPAQLNSCRICGSAIPKRKEESWLSYDKKLTCSKKCAATLREKKKRGEDGPMFDRLTNALNLWARNVIKKFH